MPESSDTTRSAKKKKKRVPVTQWRRLSVIGLEQERKDKKDNVADTRYIANQAGLYG
jgi:hypothetical protein